MKNKNKSKKGLEINGFFESRLFGEKQMDKENGILLKDENGKRFFKRHDSKETMEVDFGFWDKDGIYKEDKQIISKRDI